MGTSLYDLLYKYGLKLILVRHPIEKHYKNEIGLPSFGMSFGVSWRLADAEPDDPRVEWADE